jgi:hypothetical protein
MPRGEFPRQAVDDQRLPRGRVSTTRARCHRVAVPSRGSVLPMVHTIRNFYANDLLRFVGRFIEFSRSSRRSSGHFGCLPSADGDVLVVHRMEWPSSCDGAGDHTLAACVISLGDRVAPAYNDAAAYNEDVAPPGRSLGCLSPVLPRMRRRALVGRRRSARATRRPQLDPPVAVARAARERFLDGRPPQEGWPWITG